MSTGGWTVAVGGVVGVALAGYGVHMLVTGRAPSATARAFRSVKDAGCYHLLFGVALVLVVLGTSLPGNVPAMVTTLLAVALVGVGVIRFRPRGRRSAGQK